MLVAVGVTGTHARSGTSSGNLVNDIHTDLARYIPGQAVTISVDLTNRTGRDIHGGTVSLSFYHLDHRLGSPLTKTVSLAAGASRTLRYTWVTPATDNQGYTVTAWVRGGNNHILDHGDTAVDVSSSWTTFPRFGFMADYPSQPEATSAREIAE